jgi:hypothetical protein
MPITPPPLPRTPQPSPKGPPPLPKSEQIKTTLPATKKKVIEEKAIPYSWISGGEWIIVVSGLFFVDGLQIGLDLLFGSGIVLNRIVDIAVGIFFGFYLIVRGEFRNPKTRTRIILAILATFFLELVPILDIAPFWVLDGIYTWRVSKKGDKAAHAQRKRVQEMVKEMTKIEKEVRKNAFLNKYIEEGEQYLERERQRGEI